MPGILRDLFESIRKPGNREVFFRSLRTNRRIIFWYSKKLVLPDSRIESQERLTAINRLRKEGRPVTLICNHLTYADSHIIETLLMRSGYADLARHIIHIAGQKTFDFTRRMFTRSLNTIRVYQPKARIDKQVKRKMNSRALKWAAHLQRRGYIVLVFPEGTRTRRHKRFNPEAANPKSTIYFRHSHVVPLALMGAEKIMPVGQILQSAATVTLKVGEPIDHDQLEQTIRLSRPDINDHDLRRELMSQYMRKIQELLAPEYQPV
jgi:1-acyl-sn-glycerol-3-phosphate acyltransferase